MIVLQQGLLALGHELRRGICVVDDVGEDGVGQTQVQRHDGLAGEQVGVDAGGDDVILRVGVVNQVKAHVELIHIVRQQRLGTGAQEVDVLQ